MSDDSTAETTQSFAPQRRPEAPGEKTATFMPGTAGQPPGTTQSFAPSPPAQPQSLQWTAPAPAAPPESPPAPEAAAPEPAAPEATTQTVVSAVAEPEPAEAPIFPERPSTLKAGGILAVIQGVALVAGGALITVLANGTGDWLQKRLDDWNSSHSATSIDTFKHAADVVGLGAVAFGLVVLILAGSSLLYGQSSRLVLTGTEVLLIAAAAVGVVVSPLSLVLALAAIIVIALILAPETSRAFATARDAEEEWRATL